jgi:hypothetical protein
VPSTGGNINAKTKKRGDSRDGFWKKTIIQEKR